MDEPFSFFVFFSPSSLAAALLQWGAKTTVLGLKVHLFIHPSILNRDVSTQVTHRCILTFKLHTTALGVEDIPPAFTSHPADE